MSSISVESINRLFYKIVTFSRPTDGILTFVQPEVLEKQLAERLHSCGEDEAALEKTIDFVMNHCLNTAHPMFFNQLYGAVNPIGLAGAFIVEKMNTNQHTYEVAPVFVLTELLILKELRKLFFGHDTGDGIFAPGGSMGNMYAMVLARHRIFPEAKDKGLSGLPPLVVYTSEDSHYSVTKAAHWMGIGMENVVKVPTCKEGSMIVPALEDAIRHTRESGKIPLIVIATAGTTVLGAFDPLPELSEICTREKIWLHCDGAWGGAFIFSPKLKEKCLQGVEKCDSVLYNAHKMICAPLQCSILITREENVLAQCNTSAAAAYLFQRDKYYPPIYDTSGDKSFQCGRKADAFKLWLMWAAFGLNGFRDLVEKTEDCARYFTDSIRNRDDFLLYLDTHQCTNVFFWYIPSRMRDQERTNAWWKEIGRVTGKLKEAMVFDDSIMIGYSPLPHKKVPNALRLVLTTNPPKTHEHMDFIIQNLTRLGQDL